MLGHGRRCLSVSGTLHLPLLQIADQFWERSRCDEPLIAGRTRNFFRVEKTALAVTFDLSFRSRHASCAESLADLVDCQSVTELVVVLLWPAEAGRVIHADSVSDESDRALSYPPIDSIIDREVSSCRNMFL